MSNEPQLLQFVKQNEPVTRKEIIREFPQVTHKTIYLNIRKLVAAKKLFEDSFGNLSTSLGTGPVWSHHSILTSYTNHSMIANAFARQNPEFIKMCRELSQKTIPKITALLCDLTIIANAMRSEETVKELASQYKFTKKVDIHELTNRFLLLQDLILQYEYSEKEVTID